MKRKHIYYRGRVQGVGFRFRTLRVAANYNVCGYVRNAMDGRVEVVVEGADSQIELFLADLADTMSNYIRETSEQTEPYTGSFNDFGVKF